MVQKNTGSEGCGVNRDIIIIYRNDRGSRHGGGVALYVKDNLSATLRAHNNSVGPNVECLWLTIKRQHAKSLTIGTMYRPPSANNVYYDAMVDIIDRITSEDDDVVVLGDLNYDYVYDEMVNCHWSGKVLK